MAFFYQHNQEELYCWPLLWIFQLVFWGSKGCSWHSPAWYKHVCPCLDVAIEFPMVYSNLPSSGYGHKFCMDSSKTRSWGVHLSFGISLHHACFCGTRRVMDKKERVTCDARAQGKKTGLKFHNFSISPNRKFCKGEGNYLFICFYLSFVSSLISPSSLKRQNWIPYFILHAYPTLDMKREFKSWFRLFVLFQPFLLNFIVLTIRRYRV